VPTSLLPVRPVEPGEIDAVAALTVAVYRGEGFSTADYEPSLRDARSRADTATVLVALDGERLVGTVTVATRLGPWAEQAVLGEAVVRMLVVAPEARRLGAGEALMHAALETARRDGCSLVRLCSQDDMTAAHRLYGRLGFTRVPSFDWSPVPGLGLRAFALPLVPWCGHCGRALPPQGHPVCRAGALDPPRYCAHCRGRLIVQATPTGRTVRCSEHGPAAAGVPAREQGQAQRA
jgi:ribosomal protein S18 acetylase RimI-like enzyme